MKAIGQLLFTTLWSLSFAAAQGEDGDSPVPDQGVVSTDSSLSKRALLIEDRPFFHDFPPSLQCSLTQCYPDATLVRIIKERKKVHPRRDYFIASLNDGHYFTFRKQKQILNGKEETIHYFMNGYTGRSVTPCTKNTGLCPLEDVPEPQCNPGDTFDPAMRVCTDPQGNTYPPHWHKRSPYERILPKGTHKLKEFPPGVGCIEKKFRTESGIGMPHFDYDETFAENDLERAILGGFQFTGHRHGAIVYLPRGAGKSPAFMLFNAVKSPAVRKPGVPDWIFTFTNVFPGTDPENPCDECAHSNCIPYADDLLPGHIGGTVGGHDISRDPDNPSHVPGSESVERDESSTLTARSVEEQTEDMSVTRSTWESGHKPPICRLVSTRQGLIRICDGDDHGGVGHH